MLFDTSSPNRKRFVQITFALLAIQMGGGLVLFGIGSNTGDGGVAAIFDGNGQPIDETAKKDAEAAQKVLDANPRDEAAAAKLAKARLTIATQGGIDANGQVTEDGAGLLAAADTAWTKYLALGPSKPDGSTSILFSSFYASQAVAKYDKAARALEAALVTRKANSGLYAQLAIYGLASGNDDKYKEARARSLELATTDERRKAVAAQLDEIKAQIDEQRAEAASQAEEQTGDAVEGTSSTTPPLKTLPNLQLNPATP